MIHRYILSCIITGCLIFSSVMILQGCNGREAGAKVKTETLSPYVESEKGDVQLWSENCMQCHNMRNPASYSDAQWQVAMHHMRVRANLTAKEHRRILQFLKESN